ncbi:zeta toxin family protein [Streptomyces sp. NPDC056352]|uniref:zeta toxin family protein n=1 Tax=Streptomyces sp. NPDC056352 TaxID=3345791 RepID=UPI0035D53D66
MTDPAEFYLPEEELAARFEGRVREFVFGGYEPQDQQTLVLLGGQPAAGKSQAMAATGQRHAGRLVPLTGDELRPLHPRYQELLAEDAQTRETATAQSSGAWVRMSIEHALREGYSLLLEGVFRDPSMTIGTAERFAQEQVVVELVALAVREERSRLDALDRFLEGGRGTPPPLQDLAYRMVPETVAAAEASAAVHWIVITNRTGTDLYVNERDPVGRWQSDPAAVQGLEDERARPLPMVEAAQWLAKYRTVIVQMAARGEVNDVSRPVLQQLARDADAVAVMAHPDPSSPVRLTHQASTPLLAALVDRPVGETSLPVQLLSGLPASAEGREEVSRRAQLSPAVLAAEDALRSAFAVARDGRSEKHAAASRSKPPDAPQVSAAAARARSTTTGKASKKPITRTSEQPAHLRRPGHEPRQGPKPGLS